MRVAILDLDGDAAEALADELRAADVDALACAVDVGTTDTLRAAAQRVAEVFGACNVLCAHVGGGGQGRFEDLGEDDWLTAMQVMVVGTVATGKAFLPLMRASSGYRRIVLTSSTAALAPGRYQGPYRAAKAAVTSIGETLHRELHDAEGIGVTVAFPSGMQPNSIVDMARGVAGMTEEELVDTMGDPVLAGITHEMVRDPSDIETGDAAAQPIVDAVIAGRQYVITHGSAFERAYRERAAAVDQAFAGLAARPIPDRTTGHVEERHPDRG